MFGKNTPKKRTVRTNFDIQFDEIQKIAMQNMNGSDFEKPPHGGPDGQKICEGAVFSDKRGEEEGKIVKVSVSQMQPVRMHMDEVERNCAPPQSIHDFGGSVCWILNFGRTLVLCLGSC